MKKMIPLLLAVMLTLSACGQPAATPTDPASLILASRPAEGTGGDEASATASQPAQSKPESQQNGGSSAGEQPQPVSSAASSQSAPAPDANAVQTLAMPAARNLPAVPDKDAADRVLQYCYDISAAVLTQEKKNTVFSPVSAYYPLAMMAAGAQGDSLQALQRLLHAEGFSAQQIAQQADWVYQTTNLKTDFSEFATANSMWLQQGLTLNEDFAKLASQRFHATVNAADFAGRFNEVKQAIINWGREQTHGKVEPQPPIRTDTLLALCNAVYIKDVWEESFGRAPDAVFTGEDGQKKTCGMIGRSLRTAWKTTDRYTAVNVQLSGTGMMTFIVPAKGRALSSVLAADVLNDALTQPGAERTVELTIPRLKTDSHMSLQKPLISLGLESLFYKRELSGLVADDALLLQAITQDVHLEWDESGIEAAAVTVAAIAKDAAPPVELPPVTMKLDTPFVYVLHGEAGIYMIGTCYMP